MQWAGLAVAGVGIVQTVLGADEIYGIYQASVSLENQVFLTSFVNPNHAAALMLLSASISFGLWVSSSDPVATKFHFLATGLLVVAVCATGSKACIALLVITLVSAGGWAAYRHDDDEMKERTFRGSAAIVLGLVLLFFFAAPPHLLKEVILESDWRRAIVDEQLLSRWEVGGTLASGYWFVGTGAGAFGVAASEAMSTWSGGLVTYAHNFVLQAVADWGAIISLIIACLLLAGVWGLMKRAKWRAECVALAVGIGLFSTKPGRFFLPHPRGWIRSNGGCGLFSRSRYTPESAS